MGFKYTYLLVLILGFVSCQEIDTIQPKPTIITHPKVVVPDSSYTNFSCQTNFNLYNESFSQIEFTVLTQSIFKYSTYMSLYFDDINGNYIEIFMKRQNLVAKNFTIIPYDNTFNFSSYNEAMILFHGINYSNDITGKSGKFNFESNSNLGFCKVAFSDKNQLNNFNLSFTW